MKKLILLCTVVIIALAGYFLLPAKLEPIIIEELEKQGYRVFGTPVKVTDIAVNIKKGSATINQISIANPKGYTQPFAMTLSSITAEFDYKSGIINQVIVSDPHIVAEFLDNRLNIMELAGHAESARRSDMKPPPPPDDETPSDAEEKSSSSKKELMLTINLAALENPTIDIIIENSQQAKRLTIDRLETHDLYGTSHQLANQLVKGLFNDLAKQVIAQSLSTVEEEALEKLKDKALDKLKDLFN